MKTPKQWIRLSLGVPMLIVAAMALPWAAGEAAGLKHPTAALQAAKTPADHEGLAAYYEVQAKDLEAKAVEHEQMAKVYDSDVYNPVYRKLGYGQHCRGLVSAYRHAAQKSIELANMHRKLAGEAAK